MKHLRFEIIRDRYPHDRNGLYLWLDLDAQLYENWEHGDPENPIDKPKATLVIAPSILDQIVVGWLRGPEGPCGPMGATGARGAGAD